MTRFSYSAVLRGTLFASVWMLMATVNAQDSNVTDVTVSADAALDDDTEQVAPAPPNLGSLFEVTPMDNGPAAAPPVGAAVNGLIYREAETLVEVANGAKVELLSSDDRLLKSTIADEAGYYGFNGLNAGSYRVRVSGVNLPLLTQGIELTEATGLHNLNFIISASEKPVAGQVVVGVFEETPNGKFRRTDAAVVFTKGDQREILQAPDILSGAFETALDPGTWQVTASVAGTYHSTRVDITSGQTTEQEIVLASAADEGSVTALIAVLKQGANAATPEVQFLGSAEPVPAKLAAAPTPDDTTSGWTWYWATPQQPLTPGDYRVAGTCTGYLAATTGSQPVGVGETTFQLTFRPESDLGRIAGVVRQQTGEAEPALLSDAVITFASDNSPETRELTSNNAGEFSASLPAGKWWGTARAAEFQSPRGVLVTVTAGADTTVDFNLKRPDPNQSPSSEVQQIIEALVAVNGPAGTSPSVQFQGNGTALVGVVRDLTPEEKAEFGLNVAGTDDTWHWYIATPEQPLPAGIWRAQANLGELQTESSAHTVAADSSICFHLSLNTEQSDTGTLILKVVDEAGLPVGPAHVRLWHDEQLSPSRTLQTDATGQSLKELRTGLWWGSAQVSGYEPGVPSACAIAPGENNLTLTVTRTAIQPLTAMVSVQRQWTTVAAELPIVEFVSEDGTVTTAETRPVSAESVGGSDEGSGWDWFSAVPSSPLTPGACNVTARNANSAPDSTSVFVVAQQSQLVFLTLRPPVDQPPSDIKVHGDVYLAGPNDSKQLMSDVTLVFDGPPGIDAVSVNAPQGHYEARLLPGVWVATVVDASQTARASVVMSLGEQPEVTQDFLVPMTARPFADVVAVIEVLEPRPDQSPPKVTFQMAEQTPLGQAGPPRNVAADVTRMNRVTLNGAQWFMARPKVDVAEGTVCSAQADAGEAYRRGDSQTLVATLGQPNLLNITLHPAWHETRPGGVVGCVLPSLDVANARPDEAPDDDESALPLRDARLMLRNLDTDQVVLYDAPDGCFEIDLPPGRWQVDIKLPDAKPWRVAQPLVIPEGIIVERNFIAPQLEMATPPPATDVRVFLAVRSAAGLTGMPSVSLNQFVTVSEVRTRTTLKNTPQGVAEVEETYSVDTPVLQPGPECRVHQLSAAEQQEFGLESRGLDAKWTWYLALPEGPVPQGQYMAMASLDGFEAAFGDGVPRQVLPGLPTVFELGLEQYQPQIDVVVTGSDDQPLAGLDVRLINRDLNHSLAQASQAKTDANGACHLELQFGAGNYNVMLSGGGIEPQGKSIRVVEPTTTLSFKVYRKGEMRAYPLRGTVLDTENAAIPSATITLIAANERALPANIRPLASAADGSFSWDEVPAGNYEVIAEAQGYQSARQQLSLVDNAPPVQLRLRAQNPEFAAAMQQLLNDGWGSSSAHRQAAQAGYTKAKSLAPDYIAVDLALALVHLNNQKALEAKQLICAASREDSSQFEASLSEQFADRANELQIWTHLLLNRYPDTANDLQTFSAGAYHNEPPTAFCADSAYLMGVGAGMMLGPKKDKARGFSRAIDQQVEQALNGTCREAYVRGRERVLQEHGERDGQKQLAMNAGQEALDAQKMQELADLEQQLAKIEGEMQTLANENTQGQQKANARVLEIDGQINILVPQRDNLSGQGAGIEQRARFLNQQLNEIRRQRNLQPVPIPEWCPEEGGFLPPNGGGPNGVMPNSPNGADLAEPGSQTRFLVYQFPGADPSIEQERMITAELFQLQNTYGQLKAQWLRVSQQIQGLQANRQAVINAWQLTFNQLDGRFRELQALQLQLQNRAGRINGKQPENAGEVKQLDQEQRDVQTYFSYPLEIRRQEILRSL